MSTESFPLVTLHPVADAHHRWSGMLLQWDGSGDPAALSRLCGEFGLLESLGQLPCVLTLPDPALLPEGLPADKLLLNLPLERCLAAESAPALAALAAAGFACIATGLPAADAVLPPAIKGLALDHRASHDAAVVKAWLGKLPGPHMAFHVDDPAQRSGCHDLGFRWIAGNYPLQATAAQASNNPGRTIMLKLLAQITSDADSSDIEKTLRQDPNLSFQLLKLVNSVAFSLTTKISSFTQAIALLGRRQLQRWLQLLLYARPHGQGDDVSPLMPRAALRAGLMEGLADAAGSSKEVQDQAFMVGMFSLLEPLIGQPVADVIKTLNLAEDVTIALGTRQGRLGGWLAAIEAAESGPTPAAAQALAAAGISHDSWARQQAKACRWAVQVSSEA